MSAPGRPRRDEADLFREFNSHLVRIVNRRTDATRDVVDDACAYAWQQFIQHQPDRERNWRAWMITTAERDVWRLSRLANRDLSLSSDENEHGELGTWDVRDEHDRAGTRLRLRRTSDRAGTLTLGTDNRSAFTARAFTAVLTGLGIARRRGGYRDPECQAFIESWFGKLKERCARR